MVKDAGILYAPDYVINAGGLINVCAELKSISAEEALSDAKRIYDTMLAVYEEAERQNIPTHKASDLIAEQRIAEAKKSTKRSRLLRAAPCSVDSPSSPTLASRHIGPDALPLALIMKDFIVLWSSRP